jgi:hypothetical protein
VRARSTFKATIAPTGAVAAGAQATVSASGTLRAERPRSLRFPPDRVPQGVYRITVVVTTANSPTHSETVTSPPFTVG